MRCLISGLMLSLVLACSSISLAQCLPAMGAPAPNAPSSQPTAIAPVTAALAPTATDSTVIPQVNLRRSPNPFGNVSPADAYLQSLTSMSPMAMMTGLAGQQAAVVRQQQARTAMRHAMREPARARMREQNAERYYEAGRKAEAAGNYTSARKYFGRAANIDGGQFSQDAQQALSALIN